MGNASEVAVNIDALGGLNVAADPFDVGAVGAVDLLNVDVGRRGKRLRVRDGYAKFNSNTLAATSYDGLIYGASTNGGEILATRQVTGPTRLFLDKIDSTGVATN